MMPAAPRLFSCTPSRLAAFDCPRRYRFRYVDRPSPKSPPWAHSSVGATVHTALARWWSLAAGARTPAAGRGLVADEWQPIGFRDGEQSERWRSVAGGWVQRYLESVDPRREPAGVERTVATTTASLAVSGRVDRIDERGDELVVIDYKTGRAPSTTDDARGSQALALYVVAVRRTLRRACRRVELHHLPSGTVAAFEHTDESLQRHIARAEASAEDITTATDTLASGADPDDVFPPLPSPSCSWCDYRAHCPEGRVASLEREPWAALGEDR
jgi:RecB family exonuclease